MTMRHLRIATCLFFVLLSFAAVRAEAGDVLASADSAYRAFNYDLAIKLYQDAQTESPSADVCIKLADAYFFGGYEKKKGEQEAMYLKAKDALLAAAKQKPDDAEIYARLGQVTGQIALFRGNKEKVKLGLEIKNYADKALAIDPSCAMANAVLGIWHYELAGLGFVEKTFAKILFGGVPEGKYELAEKYLAKAVKENPNAIYYRNAYAKALMKTGKDDEAKAQLEAALKMPIIVAGDKQNKRDAKELLTSI
jgi:tetratricopeptide (TPR) repeat protein